jgi:hypothetical protein
MPGIRAALVFSLFTAFLPGGRPAFAMPHISDFPPGLSRQDALLRSTRPCGDNLCGEALFGGESWTAVLNFRDDALFALALSGPPEKAYVDAAFLGFAESPYTLYNVATQTLCFDFVLRAREGGTPEQLDAEFEEFLRDMLSSGSGSAVYLYTEPGVYEAARNSPEAPSLPCGPQTVRDMPDGAVCCLSISPGAVSVVVTTWAAWQEELAARLAAGDPPFDPASP